MFQRGASVIARVSVGYDAVGTDRFGRPEPARQLWRLAHRPGPGGVDDGPGGVEDDGGVHHLLIVGNRHVLIVGNRHDRRMLTPLACAGASASHVLVGLQNAWYFVTVTSMATRATFADWLRLVRP